MYLAFQYSFDMSSTFINNWEIQVRKGLVELCILNVISRREMYGYDIVRKLTEDGSITATVGTIYPLLSRLRREGLIEATLKESDQGPARKYYKISPHGIRTLRKMNNLWDEVVHSVEKSQQEEKS